MWMFFYRLLIQSSSDSSFKKRYSYSATSSFSSSNLPLTKNKKTNAAKWPLTAIKCWQIRQVLAKPTCPSAYIVLSIVVGDKKSLFRRFLALLSLNQSFSGSGKILSPFPRLVSGTFSRFPRNAELSARTVGVIRSGEGSSMFSITNTNRWARYQVRSAHPHPAHIFC